MPSHGLQTKTKIHYKHKWIIEISPKLQTLDKIQFKKKKKRCEMKNMENITKTRTILGFT
jgi:hypothetical protein